MEDNEKLTLSTPEEELEKRILTENDPDQLKNIINLFNLNIKKKDILRTGRLNDLQDKTLNQIEERIEKTPDLFSNKDLLDYYKTIQETINKTDLSTENLPTININQNILNVENSSDALDKDSRDRVMNAVKAILEKSMTSNDIIDVNIIDKENADNGK